VWITRQKTRQRKLHEMEIFFRKAIYAMEEEKARWIVFFENYESRECIVMETLHEIAFRLRQNIYPKGEDAWEAVFMEKKNMWDCSESSFHLLLQSGHAFFGKSRKENSCFLQSYLRQLEECQAQEKQKFQEEKKVWIPVSMLGGCMMVIILF
ncbi:MAG: hypothetical protein IKJ01_00085, partial [Lachnospiraceae bacterium]|nr:hypothetical protein [Lachnospiraceae bacterium]